MTRILLFGVLGRMGRIAASEFTARDDISLVGGVERPDHPDIGVEIADIKVMADGGEYPDADVWLDFSLAGPAVRHCRTAAKANRPIVVAATGFNGGQLSDIETAAQKCAVLLAPNLSTGIGVMDHLLETATRALGNEFDAVMVELHHRGKRDAPSGTAKRLAETIERAGGKVAVTALRAGGAVGEHSVRLVGDDEELVITHRAWSRRAFARGAVRAVKFAATLTPGLYDIRDVYAAGR